MKDETRHWIQYAEENLEAAKVLLQSRLYNPCLQNIQQASEKYLKALCVEFSVGLKKTHNIHELIILLKKVGKDTVISEDECDLLDSIYLPSKYPLGSVLPDFDPCEKICVRCMKIASKIKDYISGI